jgi:extradiol dioxygenase family protein
VFFIDCCSLIDGRESNIIVTVSLAGALHCKKPPDSIHFLKEVRDFLNAEQSSVVLLFNDEFAFSGRLEETNEAFTIRKNHSLCFLPRISLVPNPCMAIANILKQMFTE